MRLDMALEHTVAYLLLGGNLGKRQKNLEKAIVMLDQQAGQILAKSSVYETAAWGKTDQPAFLNQAVAISTQYGALELLDKALDIEQQLGRIRLEKWGERLIDIDLILFGDQVVNIENRLQIPHPHMQNRKFVMEPLAEIAPDVIHPVLNRSMRDMLENLSDELQVSKL